MKRIALITGITGQDGSWLTELLLSKGYDVHGVVRRTSTPTTQHLDRHLSAGSITLHPGEITDQASLEQVIRTVKPDEIYHLAAQSHVGLSFRTPVHTADVVALGSARLFDAVRRFAPGARVYNACSSEIFGTATGLQDESTPLRPRNPYGAAKAHAHALCEIHRAAYGLHISSGILFNHESERRGEQFVTRKITRAVGRIRAGLQQRLELGNLSARRDWGYAADYVDAMWRMVQQDRPGDYVVATGISHSVQDFVTTAFSRAGLNWEDHVQTSERLLRPADVDELCGDARRAKEELGWQPTVGFDELVARMVDHDIRLAETERASL